jgi:uncharacterized protein (TIGR01777 family)
MRIAITGGTGFIGRSLVGLSRSRGHTPVVLTRDVDRAREKLGRDVECVVWQPEQKNGPWESVLEQADALVNLAGEPIESKRWNPEFKQFLRDSRIVGTNHLVDAMGRAKARPRVLVNASATNYYGRTSDTPVYEDGRQGSGFTASMLADWERAARGAEAHGIRVVLLRIPLVLGDRGGGLEKMFRHFLYYLGGPLGGDQWVPWIHVDDLVEVILRSIETDELSGPINCSTPSTVRMRELTRQIGVALDRPSWLPIPEVVVRGLMGEMAEIILDGANAQPGALRRIGFEYRYPDLSRALRSMLGRTPEGVSRAAGQ